MSSKGEEIDTIMKWMQTQKKTWGWGEEEEFPPFVGEPLMNETTFKKQK